MTWKLSTTRKSLSVVSAMLKWSLGTGWSSGDVSINSASMCEKGGGAAWGAWGRAGPQGMYPSILQVRMCEKGGGAALGAWRWGGSCFARTTHYTGHPLQVGVAESVLDTES